MGGQPVSYAIRNDGKGWRAVKSVDDALPDETFATEKPEIAVEDARESNPVAKLIAFLKDNPDILALLK